LLKAAAAACRGAVPSSGGSSTEAARAGHPAPKSLSVSIFRHIFRNARRPARGPARTSSAAGVDVALRSLAPGGICQPVGYYLPPGTKVPLMHMYANDATLKIAVSSVRPVLPDLLDFVADDEFPAELVTTPRRPTRRTPPSSSCNAPA
jgi:hypothetical protein